MDPSAHTRLPRPIFRTLKAVRDVAADRCAAVAARSAAAERALAAAGRVLHGRSLAWDLFARRAAESLAARRSMSGPVLRRMRVDDVTIVGEPDHFTFGKPYFTGRPYEPRTTQLVLSTLRDGDVFVDVGANHGYFSVLAALRVAPAGRVFAFEPNPSAAGRLRAVVRANGAERIVTVAQVALSDGETTDTPLFLSPVAELDGLASLHPAWVGESGLALADAARVLVATATYDAWAAKVGVGTVDLMKIDVEGGEEAVVRGMVRTLRAAPPRRIVLETAAGGAADLILRDRGYSRTQLEVGDGVFGNWLYSRDG